MASLPFEGTVSFYDDDGIKACYPLKFARNPVEIQKGMMGAVHMNYALCFLINPGTQSFWMKGCFIPLDMVFCREGGVDKIFHNCPPCYQEDCPRYVGFADLVFELPGGTCLRDNIRSTDDYKIDFFDRPL